MKKLVSLLVVLAMLASLCCSVSIPVSAAVDEGTTVLAFTSDVHDLPDDHASSARLGAWIDSVFSRYGTIDVLGLCGDLGDGNNVTEQRFWAGAQAVMAVVSGKMSGNDPKISQAVYTTGNHEWYPGNFSNKNTYPALKNSYTVNAKGAEGDNYIIYCMGAANNNQSGAGYPTDQITALGSFLNSVGNDKPIIIMTHFPLHYCPRYDNDTYNVHYDTRVTANASAVISALNTAAATNHQKIVLLWGHNHTNADPYYDHIYAPGDQIQSTSSGSNETIQFYYAAAGCMSDIEYSIGSDFVSGKGLVITINDSTDQLSFTYYDETGLDLTAVGSTYTESVPASADSVTLNKSEETVCVGQSVRLWATVLPNSRSVTWSSGDDSIATVDQNGTVTGVGTGETTIIATAVNGISASCTITVEELKTHCIVIDGYALSTIRSTATAYGSGNNQGYQYTGLSGVALPVSGNADHISWIIEPTAGGYYIKSLDGQYLNATYTSVSSPSSSNPTRGVLKLDTTPDVWVLDSDVDLDAWQIDGSYLKSTNASSTASSAKYLGYENGQNLFAIRSYGNADKTLLMEPDKTPVTCYVETNSLVNGNDYIVAVTKDDGSVYAVKNVSGNANANTGSVTLSAVPATETAPAYIDTSDAGVSWKYSGGYLINSSQYLNTDNDNPYASSSSAAITYANEKLQIGNRYLTCDNGTFGTSSDSGSGASVRLFVKGTRIAPPLTGLTLSSDILSLAVGDEAYLTASQVPATAVLPDLTWSSSDETVATVNANGRVTAVEEGETVITVSGGDFSAVCTVTVSPRQPDEYRLGALTIRDSNGAVLTAVPAGSFLVTIPVTKQTGEGNALVVLAAYTAAGQFRGLLYVTVEDAPVGSTVKVTLPVDNTAGDIARLKAFAVAGFGSFTPISPPSAFPAE